MRVSDGPTNWIHGPWLPSARSRIWRRAFSGAGNSHTGLVSPQLHTFTITLHAANSSTGTTSGTKTMAILCTAETNRLEILDATTTRAALVLQAARLPQGPPFGPDCPAGMSSLGVHQLQLGANMESTGRDDDGRTCHTTKNIGDRIRRAIKVISLGGSLSCAPPWASTRSTRHSPCRCPRTTR